MSELSYEEAVARITGPGSPSSSFSRTFAGPDAVFKNRPKNLREVLQNSLEHGDAELAVWDTGERWTFASHERSVASVAAALAAKHGIGKGSRVAILAANRLEWIPDRLGTLALGGTVVAMNGWWQGDEIEYGIGLGEPTCSSRIRATRASGRTSGSRRSSSRSPSENTRISIAKRRSRTRRSTKTTALR